MVIMKLSTLILTVLHLSTTVLMLILLNRHYSKSSFNCPFCELFGAAFSCKNNLFSSKGGFTSRLSRPQWVRGTLLGLERSSKFMAALQRAHEDQGGWVLSFSVAVPLWGYESVLSILIELILVVLTVYVEEHWCGDTHRLCQNTLLVK